MSDAVLSKFAEHGVLGLVTLVLLYTLRSVYQELKEERKGRLEDAGRYSDSLLKLTDRVHETSNALAKTAEGMIEIAQSRNAGQGPYRTPGGAGR